MAKRMHRPDHQENMFPEPSSEDAVSGEKVCRLEHGEPRVKGKGASQKQILGSFLEKERNWKCGLAENGTASKGWRARGPRGDQRECQRVTRSLAI